MFFAVIYCPQLCQILMKYNDLGSDILSVISFLNLTKFCLLVYKCLWCFLKSTRKNISDKFCRLFCWKMGPIPNFTFDLFQTNLKRMVLINWKDFSIVKSQIIHTILPRLPVVIWFYCSQTYLILRWSVL